MEEPVEGGGAGNWRWSELVEVFSITYKCGSGEAPSGTISIFDGERRQIIYSRVPDRIPSARKPSDSGTQNGENAVELVLTGPYRAISAEQCVVIVLDLHHDGCKDTDNIPYVTEISVDTYDPSTIYDESVRQRVLTCTCQDAPIVEVTYALLSDAVEAVVEAKLSPLLGEREDDLAAGCGFYMDRIVARNAFGDVVLFLSSRECMPVGSSDESLPISIPLARSILAVPLTSPLMIDVELHDRSGGEIRNYSEMCHPDLDEEHVLSFACTIGIVEVKIRCSD